MTSSKWSERVYFLPRFRQSVKAGKYTEKTLDQLYDEVCQKFKEWRDTLPFAGVTEKLGGDNLALDLLGAEGYLFDPVKDREALYRQRDWLENPNLDPLIEAIRFLTQALIDELPTGDPSPFRTTYGDLYGQEVIKKLCNTILENKEWQQARLFERSTMQILAHLDPPPKVVTKQLLEGTPFEEHFDTPTTLPVPYETYFSHIHCVAGSGVGKSQFLSELFLYHAKHRNRPSIVVVDSQGDLINSLLTLEQIQDRTLYIDPRNPPSINLFTVDMFDYLFSGIVGADLTAKQNVFFRFVARLMMQVPRATMLDLLNIMDDITPYLPYINKLPELQRRFFEKDFMSKTFAQTKEQVRYRINAIIEHPTMERLFTSKEQDLDLHAALNRGDIILVDTSKEYLKGASSAFGRVFISLILQAILDRAAIPENERHPTFLLVDEAGAYFDQNIDDLLVNVRKYKCGCVFAHQYMEQCTPSLRASLAANTSIKMVSGVSMSDARSLAPDLRTTADEILAQPRLHFSCYVRNVTERAVSIEVTPGLLDQETHKPRERAHVQAYVQELQRNEDVAPPSIPETHEPPREAAHVLVDTPTIPDESKPGQWIDT